MTTNLFQKGKFYTLPIKEIRNEGSNSFFIVCANDKEYAIRMFDFQKTEPSVIAMKDLPCMVKDIHGDNIIFVQNFAQMFSERYIAGNKYPFIVSKEAYVPASDYRYYDIRDFNGVPFRIKCSKSTYLVHNQKIKCIVSRPTLNRMFLTLDKEKKSARAYCISPKELLDNTNADEATKRYIQHALFTNNRFQDAKKYFEQGSSNWVIKAITAISGVEKWSHLKYKNIHKILNCYHQICLYLLEDSNYLLQFSDSERENYQEWIAGKVSMAETYQQCLSLMKENKCSEEIDSILSKIKNSGYIFHPHRRMRVLIALFSLQPSLLEEKIDQILDIIAECAKDWKQTSFNNAFSSFLHFYITSNREKANRIAIANDEESSMILKRMIRSICYYLLMAKGADIDHQLYRSILLQFLSYGKATNILGLREAAKNTGNRLVEQAFISLLLSDENYLDLKWGKDFSNIDIFAYQMANIKIESNTFLTRSFEAHNVRFSVSTDGITFSRSTSNSKEKNILPEDFLKWHNLKIYLDSPSKYNISMLNKNIRTWKSYWSNVEQGLFEKKRSIIKKRPHKIAPEVGTETYIRILWKDENHPYRYYCKIEDTLYEGEGWIDTYQRGGSIGMFHYDPQLDIDSFFEDGKPLIFKARVNSLGSPNEEVRTYTFDCMSFIDEKIREWTSYGEESDCQIFYIDERNNVFCCISSYGYGLFVPITEENSQYNVGDTVKVKITDSTRPNSIQGEFIGEAGNDIDIKEAATSILRDYACALYEETEEELEEEAMSVSEDLFEPSYMKEIINIIDHKAVLEADHIKAYAYLSIAHILAKMLDDDALLDYIEHRQNFMCILEDYGKNSKVSDEELEKLGKENSDILEKYPLLQQRLTEMKIVNCFGQPKKNEFLWNMYKHYTSDHILSKLSRLMLSYNMADGFGLQEQQKSIINKIKSLLNVNIELPTIYSFGEENQTTEFKTSIVYPPSNNMRQDIKQQTFNIMKVICGMVNSYGGTVYLGVYNTGTAKGLEDDLAYFEESKDKFDLYVRSSIRAALGDQVNASIVIEHPDAGKHFVYAIKVTPSKMPVVLRLDNKFYLREGTSTYSIDYTELLEIMKDRNFAVYNAEAKDMDKIEVSEEDNDTTSNKQKKDASKNKVLDQDSEELIATSKLRSNITENWLEGYGIETTCYLRIMDLQHWRILDDIEWPEGILTLAIHDDETDGYLIIVFEDGKVNKVPMSQLLDKARDNDYMLYSNKKPIFISPAKKDAAILMEYKDDSNKQFFRLDDVALLEDGKMQSAGDTLTDVDFNEVTFCEIIDKQYHQSLQRMHNQKRTSLGWQLFTSYDNQESETFKKIGIKL